MKALIIAASLIQLLTWLPRKVLHVTHITSEEIEVAALRSELKLEGTYSGRHDGPNLVSKCLRWMCWQSKPTKKNKYDKCDSCGKPAVVDIGTPLPLCNDCYMQTLPDYAEEKGGSGKPSDRPGDN